MMAAEDSARPVCDGRQGWRDGLEVNNARFPTFWASRNLPHHRGKPTIPPSPAGWRARGDLLSMPSVACARIAVRHTVA
jgi:hypothetical protein